MAIFYECLAYVCYINIYKKAYMPHKHHAYNSDAVSFEKELKITINKVKTYPVYSTPKQTWVSFEKELLITKSKVKTHPVRSVPQKTVMHKHKKQPSLMQHSFHHWHRLLQHIGLKFKIKCKENSYFLCESYSLSYYLWCRFLQQSRGDMYMRIFPSHRDRFLHSGKEQSHNHRFLRYLKQLMVVTLLSICGCIWKYKNS